MSRVGLDALELIAVGSVATTGLAIAATGVDLTFPQWRVLLVVGEAGDGATVSEIARRVGSHLSPASRLVARLERRGLLATATDAHDARATRVTLTAAGADLRARILERRRAYLAEAIARSGPLLPGAEDALASIARALERYA